MEQNPALSWRGFFLDFLVQVDNTHNLDKLDKPDKPDKLDKLDIVLLIENK